MEDIEGAVSPWGENPTIPIDSVRTKLGHTQSLKRADSLVVLTSKSIQKRRPASSGFLTSKYSNINVPSYQLHGTSICQHKNLSPSHSQSFGSVLSQPNFRHHHHAVQEHGPSATLFRKQQETLQPEIKCLSLQLTCPAGGINSRSHDHFFPSKTNQAQRSRRPVSCHGAPPILGNSHTQHSMESMYWVRPRSSDSPNQPLSDAHQIQDKTAHSRTLENGPFSSFCVIAVAMARRPQTRAQTRGPAILERSSSSTWVRPIGCSAALSPSTSKRRLGNECATARSPSSESPIPWKSDSHLSSKFRTVSHPSWPPPPLLPPTAATPDCTSASSTQDAPRTPRTPPVWDSDELGWPTPLAACGPVAAALGPDYVPPCFLPGQERWADSSTCTSPLGPWGAAAKLKRALRPPGRGRELWPMS